MSCYARLEKFPEAESAAIQARELYATHLQLPDDQRAKFIENGHFIDDLRPAGDRDLQQNPWLSLILGHASGPRLPNAFRGETEAERRRIAIATWKNFFNNLIPIKCAVAHLTFSNGQFLEAVKHLESLILLARQYENVSPLRVEWLWPRIVLGECYWGCGQKQRAVEAWQSARSLEFHRSLAPESDDWDSFGMPWLAKAKSRLAEQVILAPLEEVSLRASQHLRKAIGYILEAENCYSDDADVEELMNSIRQAGRNYVAPLERASSELEFVERLDRFTWAKSPCKESSYWGRYESVKGLLLEKVALLHMSNEKVGLAIASYKQAMDIWPRLSSGAFLGWLQVAFGLPQDGGATYRTCIERAYEFGILESDESCENILREVEQALHELR
jgi:tetratricopeptide (TPR) repeat protein